MFLQNVRGELPGYRLLVACMILCFVLEQHFMFAITHPASSISKALSFFQLVWHLV